MKTIGLLGNTSWPSTFLYYERLNRLVSERLGGYHSAKIMLYGIDYHPIKTAYTENPDAVPGLLKTELLRLIDTGVDGVIICNNTLHRYFDILQRDGFYDGVVFHALRLTAEKAAQKNYARVLLLGTKQTMRASFYHDYFAQYNIQTVTPDSRETDAVQAAQSALASGGDSAKARDFFHELIDSYKNRADAVALGCTELPLVINENSSLLPLINPTELQCDAAVDFMLA